VLARSIESAAAVEPIWNWPQLIGGRVIGASLGQVTIDHDLSYDALAADGIDLRRLVCWPAGECRRGHHYSRSDPGDPYVLEHLILLQERARLSVRPAQWPAVLLLNQAITRARTKGPSPGP